MGAPSILLLDNSVTNIITKKVILAEIRGITFAATKGVTTMGMNTDSIHENDGFGAGLLLGSLIGALIGAGLALWYAPQTGKRTQHVVRTEATRLQKKANKQVHNIADQALDKLEELQDQGRDLVDENLNRATGAVNRLKQQVVR